LTLQFSIIVPVYNRPDEIEELLASLTLQTYQDNFEVIIIEDGSTDKCEHIVASYKEKLNLKYLSKPNTGAGLSRNFGMKNAIGNYFIILDSDVILPPTYLELIDTQLNKHYTDAFGGPDAAHSSFSVLQKAINYSMTSFLTTGGLRGGKKTKSKFQLRSYNLGISKKAFQKTGGFSNRKIGEDIDLSFRLWENGFETQLITEALVYHKRRTSLQQFFTQTYRFGKERPLLTKQYPNSAKLSFWFPTFFVIGYSLSLIALLFNCILPFIVAALYLLLIGIDAGIKNKSLNIGLLSIQTTIVQFYGYGLGFIKGQLFGKQ
jgi:glycosyltransferase involved in cell wall biosynthesis